MVGRVKRRCSMERVPLHTPRPPLESPRPVAPHLQLARKAIADRVATLQQRRHRREEITAASAASRRINLDNKVAAIDDKTRAEAECVEKCIVQRNAALSNSWQSHKERLMASRERHFALMRAGFNAVESARTVLELPDPRTPRRTETGLRDARLQEPLASSLSPQQLRDQLERRMREFIDLQKSQEDKRALQVSRKAEHRLAREARVHDRMLAQEEGARRLHTANTERSDAACRRAARTKARVRNPRRAMAEDRLAQREADMRVGTADGRPAQPDEEDHFPPPPAGAQQL